MKKNIQNRIGDILVIIQFACLIFLAISCNVIAKNPYYLSLELVGIVLALWSIWVMRKSRLSVHPRVQNQAVLITNGPYTLIRHPMYLSVLLVCLALVLDTRGILNSLVFGILFVNLIFKIEFEERLLRRHFEEYTTLSKKTWKIVPWVY